MLNIQRFLLILFLLVFQPTPVLAQPPFKGTVWVNANILTRNDPTVFKELTYVGERHVELFDRRVEGYRSTKAFYFDARFGDGVNMFVAANAEFGTREKAEQVVLPLLEALGRLPTALRQHTRGIWLHAGNEGMGGNVEKGVLDAYEDNLRDIARRGFLEETLLHEAVHTTFDKRHLKSRGWRSAQVSDVEFISKYAAEYPTREDLAESFSMYFWLTFRPNRVPTSVRRQIESAIPARLDYLAGVLPAGTSYFYAVR